MPEFDSPRALEILLESQLDIPFIIVSGTIGEERAVQVMQRGATDYIIKDRLGRLGQAVANALEKKLLRDKSRLAERWLGAQHAMTKVLADWPDLEAAVPRILEAACKCMGWVWSAAWMVDGQGKQLELLLSWHSPSTELSELQTLCRTKTFRRGEGLPGRVWETGAPAWVPDVMRDDSFFGKHAAARAGLHAALLFPILLGPVVVGVIEFLSPRVEHPNKDLLEMMTAIGIQIGQFIERNEKVESLRKSEARYRTLIAATSAIVWNTPASGEFETEQPGWTEFTGQTFDQLRGWGWLNAIHPDDQADTARVWTAATAEKSVYRVEHRLRCADGMYRRMSVRAVPILDPGGAIREWVGVHTDVHEHRQAEIDRSDLLARLQLYIERMPLAYILFDADLHVTEWNPCAQQIFGYTRAEALGMTKIDLIPPSFRPEAEELLRRIRAGDMGAHSVNENVTRDGRTITCEWHQHALARRRTARLRGFIALCQDITFRRVAEKTLRLRDRAIQAVSQGILITDPGRPDNPIIYASPSVLRLTGYSTEEVVGRNCRFLQGKETDPAAIARIRQAVEQGQPCAMELLNYRKDGTTFWNELSLAPVTDTDGQLTHFVGTQTDVTQRHQLEGQFHQAQKMEAFGQLAGGVAHDFNNLLTIISGYSEMLLGSLRPDDRNRILVQEIHTAGSRAALLTGQLLSFSRRQVVQPRVLDLNGVVAGTKTMLGRLIGEDVTLATVPAPGLDPVKADSGQIEQVILNLVVNARDAMPRGGRITIETANIDLDEAYGRRHTVVEPGRYVLLAVTDTGCGMTEEVMTRIFEPFFTTKEVGKGTGLGLATVFGIVQQSGGHVRVSSAVGRGTTFRVYLPSMIKEVVPLIEPETRTVLVPSGTETILLVEDETAVRAMTRMALQVNGYTLLEAEDGVEALRLCERHAGPIHLLVSDVVMPRMGGRELAARLTPLRPEMRVIFVSGYTDDAVVRHGIRQAEVAFLQKPFSPDTLRRKVRAVLDGVD